LTKAGVEVNHFESLIQVSEHILSANLLERAGPAKVSNNADGEDRMNKIESISMDYNWGVFR